MPFRSLVSSFLFLVGFRGPPLPLIVVVSLLLERDRGRGGFLVVDAEGEVVVEGLVTREVEAEVLEMPQVGSLVVVVVLVVFVEVVFVGVSVFKDSLALSIIVTDAVVAFLGLPRPLFFDFVAAAIWWISSGDS